MVRLYGDLRQRLALDVVLVRLFTKFRIDRLLPSPSGPSSTNTSTAWLYVDGAHHLDLARVLLIIILIDAESVNPEEMRLQPCINAE